MLRGSFVSRWIPALVMVVVGFAWAAFPPFAAAEPTLAWGDVTSAELDLWIMYQWQPADSDSVFYPPTPLPLQLERLRMDGTGDNVVWAQGTVEPGTISLASHWWAYHGMYYMGADLNARCDRSFSLEGIDGAVRVAISVTLDGNLSSGSDAAWSYGVSGSGLLEGARTGGDAFTLTPEWVGVLRSDRSYTFETSLSASGESPNGQAYCDLTPLSDCRIAFAREPLIQRVVDIPEDQGGQVRIRWWRSSGDDPDSLQITGYAIYRRAEPREGGAAARPHRSGEPLEMGPSGAEDSAAGMRRLEGWDYLMTVPVRGDALYQTVAPTLCDSTAGEGICWSAFFVSALTANPYVFYDSPPDSGYSVDNLAPSAPQNLAFAGPDLLTWDAALEDDFDYYSVYGSFSGEFDSTAVLLVNTIDPEAGVGGLPYAYFHVTATDFAGNHGEASGIENPAAGIAEDRVGPGFTIFAPRPNPSSGTVVIRFELDRAEEVRLGIFDPAGRLKASLGEAILSAGRHEILWDGRDGRGSKLGSGVYFGRLQVGGSARNFRILRIER